MSVSSLDLLERCTVHVFTENIVVTNAQTSRLVIVFQVLRRFSNDATCKKWLWATNGCEPGKIDIGSNEAFRPDLDSFINDRIRPDLDTGIEPRFGMNQGRGMDHRIRVAQAFGLPRPKVIPSSFVFSVCAWLQRLYLFA